MREVFFRQSGEYISGAIAAGIEASVRKRLIGLEKDAAAVKSGVINARVIGEPSRTPPFVTALPL